MKKHKGRRKLSTVLAPSFRGSKNRGQYLGLGGGQLEAESRKHRPSISTDFLADDALRGVSPGHTDPPTWNHMTQFHDQTLSVSTSPSNASAIESADNFKVFCNSSRGSDAENRPDTSAGRINYTPLPRPPTAQVQESQAAMLQYRAAALIGNCHHVVRSAAAASTHRSEAEREETPRPPPANFADDRAALFPKLPSFDARETKQEIMDREEYLPGTSFSLFDTDSDDDESVLTLPEVAVSLRSPFRPVSLYCTVVFISCGCLVLQLYRYNAHF